MHTLLLTSNELAVLKEIIAAAKEGRDISGLRDLQLEQEIGPEQAAKVIGGMIAAINRA